MEIFPRSRRLVDMPKIDIDARGQQQFDVDILVRTRLLVQANSGGGKSWAIRRLLEQMFGKVQQIVIDPEGEFSTLREKYGFVLVGKGGETPADVRSAGMVAEKLLQLNASAVCDLYDMKPHERHDWVKRFIEALMNAPKELWHPVAIVVDEAHKFMPERGKGESDAKEAMLMLATAGRKRGFMPIFATQRIGKLDKDGAAELLNVMIGRTFLDIDRDRAADILGVARAGRAEFDATIRNLAPGQFYLLGPAVSTSPILSTVGPVQTTHPEVGAGMKATGVTPTPEQVKSLLPKLADLPKQAEEKARTIEQFQSEIRSLRAQLAARPVVAPEVREVTVEVPTIPPEIMRYVSVLRTNVDQWNTAVSGIAEVIERTPNAPRRIPVVASAPRPMPVAQPRAVVPVGDLTGPEQRILNACAWLESIGVRELRNTAVAFLAGYTVGGGGYNNPRGALRTKGLIDYAGSDCLVITDEGNRFAQVPDSSLTVEELHERVLRILPGPEQKILTEVLKVYPRDIDKEDLANRSGYTNGGGGFNNPLGRLRTLGLVDYPRKGYVKAESLLFLEAA